MNNLYIAIKGSLITYILLFTLDFIIIRIKVKEKARYFILHLCFNIFVTLLTLEDAIKCLKNPLNSLDIKYIYSGILTTGCVTGLHIYHIINFKIKGLEEMLHHIISAFSVPIIGICCPYGLTLPLCNLIMCGIPGGIDYLLLILVKYNIIIKITEKKINRCLNLFIRYPMMYLVYYIFIIGYINSRHNYNFYMILLLFTGITLHLLNSAYYCDKVIGNYYVNIYSVKKKIN
jgi:hypothetical protein